MTWQSIALLLACLGLMIPDGVFAWLKGKVKSVAARKPAEPAPAVLISRDEALAQLQRIAKAYPNCGMECRTIAVHIAEADYEVAA